MRITIALMAIMIAKLAYSQNFESLCNEGIRNIGKKDYKNAIINFERASRLSANDSEKVYTYANIAFSYQMAGNMYKALHNYCKALEINGNDITLMQQRAGIYMYLDSTDKAITDYS